mmetsp:Transcript_64909/g.155028  ORF Transcript_64909/g.155028 Transcript_64909/m.155028 type:complete len:148 (-) Transcript_64909:69-512(-)
MSRKYQERLAQSSGISSSKPFESDFGRRILEKYGWKDGQGLGRLKDGRVDCIQAARRGAKEGLGVEKRKAEDQWDNWWSDCFNNVAKKIVVPAQKQDSDSESDSDSDDDAGNKTATEGGRITAVKKAGAMAGKLRRVIRQESGTISS